MTPRQDTTPTAPEKSRASALPVGYVDEALELLKGFNQLRLRDGRRLSATANVRGFEPWWFIQHELLWSFLIPFCQHRARFEEVLQGAQAPGELPPEVRRVCRRLRLPLAEGRGARRPVTSILRTALGRLSQLGLILFSLASLVVFRITRRDTFAYVLDHVSPGSDHDFRLAPVYAQLRKRGYRYAEYLHVRGLEEMYLPTWRNILRRGRPAVCFDMVVRLASKLRRSRRAAPPPAVEIDLDSSGPDRPFLAALAVWALRQSHQLVLETDVLRGMLRFQGARRAVIVDHSSVIGQLTAACRLAGIPALGYMHGNFTRFHAGLMAYGFEAARRHTFDLYGVWSEHYRGRLLAGDLYEEGRTFASGPLRAPSAELLEDVVNARRDRQGPIVALLISEKYAPQEEVRAYARRLAADPRILLKLKLRPGEETPHLAGPGDDGAEHEVESIRPASVYEAFAQCDVVVGTHSTVLYEAVLAHRPVVVLATSFTYGNDIVREGLAQFAESPETVSEAVARAGSLSADELLRRKTVLWGDTLADGASRLFDEAESRLWPDREGR